MWEKDYNTTKIESRTFQYTNIKTTIYVLYCLPALQGFKKLAVDALKHCRGSCFSKQGAFISCITAEWFSFPDIIMPDSAHTADDSASLPLQGRSVSLANASFSRCFFYRPIYTNHRSIKKLQQQKKILHLPDTVYSVQYNADHVHNCVPSCDW